MHDETLDQIERQIGLLPRRGAPGELREAVRADVRRELRAARWDRNLARAAAVLLAVGIGLNVGIGLVPLGARGGTPAQLVHGESRQSLVDTAVVVAEATDAATGSRFARQLAAMSGRELTADEAAAIDAALRRAGSREAANGSRG